MVQFHPDSESMPSALSRLWNMLRMNETAQVKGAMIVSKKPMYLSSECRPDGHCVNACPAQGHSRS
ncbi:hypothetical protein GCM10011401_00730 [Nesterenkonia cremea]|uniref:4Fe-4S ferredoxin-type domain-containing protein n=1 Tax=Nesterenkonia cremea TaxID=1882340 RepID=A0A917AKW2_9MICC|nr:hypothetical protein GCM10011401_00730 [Nesterenkonia cremea]